MRHALVPGSFDPMTVGHLDIVRRASGLFDRVTVAVLCNREKKYTFTPEERVKIASLTVAGVPGVSVVYSDGYLVDLCRALGACAVVKGLRTPADFEYEMLEVEYNRTHLPGLETVFLPAAPGLENCSSTEVRRLIESGGDISGLVVPEAAEYILKKAGGK